MSVIPRVSSALLVLTLLGSSHVGEAQFEPAPVFGGARPAS